MSFAFASDNLKISILQMLIKMSEADGRVSPDEVGFLKEIALRLGISDEELLRISSMDTHEMVLPESEYERIIVLYHLLFMMRVDRKIHNDEVSFCKRLGIRLGIRSDLSDDLIKLMIRHAEEKLPPDAMLQTIIKYMN